MTTLNLNAGQQAAADGMLAFLADPDASRLIISGAGGVGKTFLLGKFLKEIIPAYTASCLAMGITSTFSGIDFAATTNKAADVLSSALGVEVGTIHSLMNYRVTENFSTGETYITRTANWAPIYNRVIVVDECSFISKKMRTAINETAVNCKIIYVGDHCQLAPVKEKLSEIYKEKSPMYELTEPVRNSGQPALMALCAQFRETVETGIFEPIVLVPGVIDQLFSDDMASAVEAEFGPAGHPNKLLAYKNKTVLGYNDFIRSTRNLPEELTVGEVLVSGGQYIKGDLNIGTETSMTIKKVSPITEVKKFGDIELPVYVIDALSERGSYYTGLHTPVDPEFYYKCISHLANKADWPNYFKLKNTVLDLRQVDSSTVHKSQGSSYDTVFIDLYDIGSCNFTDQVARMMYVAVTRAINRIVFYGDLPAKYGGHCI